MVSFTNVYNRIRDMCVVIVSVQITNAIAQFVYHHFLACMIKKPIVFEKLGKWAVVTGATNGLGRAFAEEFASRGMDIVLIDSNEVELNYEAKEIEKKYSVHALPLPSPLTPSPQTYRDIHAHLVNLDIGVLVNNVHELQARPARLVEAEAEDAVQDVERIVSGNVTAVTSMCRLVMPGMVARDRGAVIVVASLLATIPSPMMATTAAAKAFEVKLAYDLAAEMQGRGVVLRTLLPGFLHCRWLRLRAPSLLAPAPAAYLRAALPLLAVHEATSGYWPHDVFSALLHLLHYVYPPLAHDLTDKCMGLLREVSIRGYL